MTDKLSEKIAAIKAGLGGLPPGPWDVDNERQLDAPDKHIEYALYDPDLNRLCGTENSDGGYLEQEYPSGPDDDGSVWNERSRRLMEHIARLDPQTVAEIIAHIERLEADNARLEGMNAELQGLDVTHGIAIDRLTRDNARLREALAWYGEQARLARLITREGDVGRDNLQGDGGTRARAALEGTNG